MPFRLDPIDISFRMLANLSLVSLVLELIWIQNSDKRKLLNIAAGVMGCPGWLQVPELTN